MARQKAAHNEPERPSAARFGPAHGDLEQLNGRCHTEVQRADLAAVPSMQASETHQVLGDVLGGARIDDLEVDAAAAVAVEEDAQIGDVDRCVLARRVGAAGSNVEVRRARTDREALVQVEIDR